MNSTIQSDLIKVPQTETAGSRFPARFSYQRNWALAELIEYHLEGKDYVFAFEFHDDILILDSEDNPSSLQFVQVKTKTTGQKWTVHELTKSEKGKKGNPDKLSIIGKLYENKKNFSSHSSQLRFVTNAYFSFIDPALITTADQLEKNDQGKIINAVQAQLGIDAVDLSTLQLEQSSLSVDDHEKHIRGILHNFFEELFGSDHNIPVSPGAKLDGKEEVELLTVGKTTDEAVAAYRYAKGYFHNLCDFAGREKDYKENEEFKYLEMGGKFRTAKEQKVIERLHDNEIKQAIEAKA